jgi:competence ComEA-like helix-hairpin-helix protein
VESAVHSAVNPHADAEARDALASAASMTRLIRSVLGGDDDPTPESDVSFALPARDILRLVPSRYLTQAVPADESDDRRITVVVEDLFDQLARGRLCVPLSQLLFAVPKDALLPEAFGDPTPVTVPLAWVVRAIDPEVFAARTAKRSVAYEIEGLPDPFQTAPRSQSEESTSATPPPLSVPPVAGVDLPSPPAALPPKEKPDDGQTSMPRMRLGLRNRGLAPQLAGQPVPVPTKSALAAPQETVAGVIAFGASLKRPAATATSESAGEMRSAATAYHLIESTIGTEGEDGSHAVVSFEMPLGEVLRLLPPDYIVGRSLPEGIGQRTVSVVVEDLFEQLARGRVTVRLSRLVFHVSPELLESKAFGDESVVTLPLASVVKALDPRLLRDRTAKQTPAYNLEGLPDLFEAPPAHTPEPVRESVPDSAPEVPSEPTAAAASTPPVAEEPLEPDEYERLGGVNLNTATVEQMLTLKGVTPQVARHIVAYREQRGPFHDIFDLFEVPRVGRRTFRAITGMSYSQKRRHRRRKLAALLKLPVARVSHLPSIAQALAAKPGFTGCVISDQDGLLLAESGAAQGAASISAIVPRMLRQIGENLGEMGTAKVESASISFGGRMVTVLESGPVYLTALHEARKLTVWQFKLVKAVAGELEWLLRRRGYVGG